MNEWNIQSRAHACQACEKSFADGQPFHTLLSDEKSEFKRLDICEPCWQAQFSEGARDRKGFISHWQGVYQSPPPAPPEAIQKENAETLLRKLVELNDPKFAAAAYILAVMLERKRLLKVREQFNRDGRRVFIYEHPKSGDLFTIADPNLQLNQLEEVQRVVGELLEHGLPPAHDAAAPESAPASIAADTTPDAAAEIPSAAPPPDPAVESEPVAR